MLRVLAFPAILSAAFAAPAYPAPRLAGDIMTEDQKHHPYVGLWVTGDGVVRHRLLPNNRYDEARGRRESAYRGRYLVTGNHIDYWDDTGFTADGTFIDGILHHGGMILYRQEEK